MTLSDDGRQDATGQKFLGITVMTIVRFHTWNDIFDKVLFADLPNRRTDVCLILLRTMSLGFVWAHLELTMLSPRSQSRLRGLTLLQSQCSIDLHSTRRRQKLSK